MSARRSDTLQTLDANERKQRLLTEKRPSQVRSIAEGFVIKDADIFLICERDGQIPIRHPHGFGLYFHDCRYLSGYELVLSQGPPEPLGGSPDWGYMGVLEFVSRPAPAADGSPTTEREELGIEWRRALDGGHFTLHDRITFTNFGASPITIKPTLTFEAAFDDVFAVRGLLAERPEKATPRWLNGSLAFAQHGRDDVYRRISVRFSAPPLKNQAGMVQFRVIVPVNEPWTLDVQLTIEESRRALRDELPPSIESSRLQQVMAVPVPSPRHSGPPGNLRSDSLFFDRVLSRSLQDLHILRSELHGKAFYAAGVPWFATLFGRDSLIASMQTLAFGWDVCADTLRLLAELQGRRRDAWKDEQPGKILHELRVGELAGAGLVPQTPYYGTVDATPMFLIVLARHAAWTGSLDLFEELLDNVNRALTWIDTESAKTDGYLAYHSASTEGLVNQGWKDSGGAIVNADGSLARPPIALVEVQGYVYRAKLEIAVLFERRGDRQRAAQLRADARILRGRFNRDFWLEAEGYFALALQRDLEPAAAVTSNPGQALWTGIVDADKAEVIVQRLMSQDMFSGWGVRTLSRKSPRYNPVGYHLGAVWPHDNALIGAGLRRYGYDREAVRIFSAVCDAATHFHDERLPEVYAGFGRDQIGIPVRYPVACHPQAWAAGSVPFLLSTLLGLEPDGFNQRIRIVRPHVPPGTDWIEWRGLRVGDGRVDLRFQRTSKHGASVEVRRSEGNVEVVTDEGGAVWHGPAETF